MSGSSSRLPIKGDRYDLRRLAEAVIEQAIIDADLKPEEFQLKRNQKVMAVHQQDAVTFLQGGPMLKFWCMWSGLNADAVADHFRKRFDAQTITAA